MIYLSEVQFEIALLFLTKALEIFFHYPVSKRDGFLFFFKKEKDGRCWCNCPCE